MRQPRIIREYDPGSGVSIRSLSYDYASGHHVPEHAHGSDQFIYATRGAMEVHSAQSVWLIPPSFALWAPACTQHRIRMTAAVAMRTLYIRRGLVERASKGCQVLSVNPLLRELILEAARIGQLRLRKAEHCALRDLLSLHIARATSVPTEIRMPQETRALSAATKILQKLEAAPSLQQVCSEVGVSTRTLQRLFKQDVGIDADSWRQQARLTRAIELLVSGFSIKQIAASVGYNQPSAFVAAFRRVFGVTPKAWVDKLREK